METPKNTTSIAPQFTPSGGIGSKSGAYTYTASGWQQNPPAKTPPASGNVSVPPPSNPTLPTTPPTIPIQTATQPQQGMDLPSKPQPQAPTDVYSGAAAYLSTLPQTGVAGLDQTLEAMQNRPGQLAEQYGLSAKQTKANELQRKLDLFNDEYRVQYEKIRTSGAQSAEQKQAEIQALEYKRAFTSTALAIDAAAANQDYQGARELMNQQVQLELEPLKMRYDFFKDMYNRTEDQKFARMMKAEDRAYEERKSQLEFDNELKLAGLGILDPKKREKFAGDATAKQAAARVGIIKAVDEYAKLAEQYSKGLVGPKEANKLRAMLDTTVGSAINVAQGQGAMGDQEAKRILSGLRMGLLKPTARVGSAAQGVIDSQKTLLKSNLDFLETAYPGASQLPVFSEFMSDEEFFGSAGSGAMTPTVNYFQVEI